MKHLLVVDDDSLLRRSLAFNLAQAAYRVSDAADAAMALALVQRDPPDLILLDIGLPGSDGLDFLRQLHTHSAIPVIFLTARRRELDQIVGLELGAEDYVTKPFDLDVLLARIRVVLRRFSAGVGMPVAVPAPLVEVGDLRIDVGAHTVQLGQHQVELAPREFDLLLALARQAGQVLSVERLLEVVWGPEYAGEPQVVYVHIRWLREKLEASPNQPQRLITVRGVGYKLLPQEPQ